MTYAVILAGGWGERLWPMSTRARPKQLLSLTGESTLVGNTLLRIATLVSLPDALVMTSGALRGRMVEELAPIPAHRIIGEPQAKNTAPAIALAAKLLAAEDSDAIMVVLPADHVIGDDDSFRAAIGLAVGAAETKRALVTLGIRPTRPETGYGYIRAGRSCGLDGVFEVESFEEKPDLEGAEGYIEAGGYFWNSGVFIWRADVFLAELERRLPDVAAALAGVSCGPGDAGFDDELVNFYESVEGISVDYGIMEKADGVLVVPADFGWDDVGAWPAIARIWPGDEDGNTVRGDALVIDSSDCVAYSESGTVAVLGMSGVVVVRTADATLVIPKDRAGDVRRIVAALRARDGK
ncbi:MAG: mannose-1-phosphate guanylyltransferase [Candidatus Eisenbacteria sp.]|nr:mannose-1-phosphate guanylyltransferase [Candidatus Eisenbacteria bacterium]MCK5596579.1 mannose-1-phosphate guanylyltransferase [Candidatus Eisenbacteria bacterium]